MKRDTRFLAVCGLACAVYAAIRLQIVVNRVDALSEQQARQRVLLEAITGRVYKTADQLEVEQSIQAIQAGIKVEQGVQVQKDR